MTAAYSCAGLRIVSDVALVGLPSVPLAKRGAPTQVDIRIERATLDRAAVDWAWEESSPWWREGDDAGYFWLEVADQVTIRLDEGGRHVAISEWSGADPEFVSHLIVDFVLPVCLDLLGRLVVHATAVDIGGAVVAFTGPTGSGKSTLAMATARRGGLVMADDALVVESRSDRCWVQPTAGTTRLLRATARSLFGDIDVGPPTTLTGKHRVDLADLWGSDIRVGVHESPLQSLIVLADGSGAVGPPTIRPVPAATAAGVLLGSVFHRGATDVTATSLLDRVIGVVAVVPVYELSYVREFDQLDDVVALAVATLGR